MEPMAFDTPEEAVKALSGVLAAFGSPKGLREQYQALARVYRILEPQSADAKALADSWMKGVGLPLMWEAAEAVANAMLRSPFYIRDFEKSQEEPE